MRNNINDSTVFGPQGWVNRLYPDIRKDLIFVFDDGWDVPYNVGNKARFEEMKAFFGSTGTGHATGVWEAAQGIPQDRPEFKAEQRRLAAKMAKKRKAEEMI